MRIVFAPQGLQDSRPAFQRREHQIKEFALTRRYAVAPLVKNTRPAGLEVLKGRKFGRRYGGQILYGIAVLWRPYRARRHDGDSRR
jgi:hypothetical protein